MQITGHIAQHLRTSPARERALNTTNLAAQAAQAIRNGQVARMPAANVDNGDIVICPEADCDCTMLVAGSSTGVLVVDGEPQTGAKLHLLREGQSWEQRDTTTYPAEQRLLVVRPGSN